jgi:peptidoglycan/xylan/chitin deacetylase (PgdA/CDA1 family)
VFRVAIPMLQARGFPALLFLNTATIHGEPDLGAVRAYEQSNALADRTIPADWLQTMPGDWLDAHEGARVVEEVRSRYGNDPRFREYQGPTATADDMARAADTEGVWFASHLHHHWAIPSIGPDLYEVELLKNVEELAAYPNSIAAFATPNGYADRVRTDLFEVPRKRGVRAIFTGTGNQNAHPDSPILDRVFFPPEPTNRHEWWYATHRRRILGRRTS